MVFLISFSTSFFSLKYKGNVVSTRPVMTKLFLLALSSVSSLKFVYYALNWTYSVHTCEILHFKWRRINNVMVTLGGRGGIDRLGCRRLNSVAVRDFSGLSLKWQWNYTYSGFNGIMPCLYDVHHCAKQINFSVQAFHPIFGCFHILEKETNVVKPM